MRKAIPLIVIQETRIEKAAGWFSDLLARRSGVLLGLWLCAVAFALAGFSKGKPLWSDELVFRWVVTLPSFHAIWTALVAGVNIDPPLDHVITHALTSVAGGSALTVRLSSIAGFCAMLLFLYWTVRRYVEPVYAFLAVLLPLCTTLRLYGDEARPYALLYGCLAAAIYCWDRAGERATPGWKIGFAFALAATLACHFFAVFALPAFLLGEFVHWRDRSEVALGRIWALIAATVPLVLFIPIMRAGRQFSQAYFDKPKLNSLPFLLTDSLSGLLLPFIVFLILAALLIAWGCRLNASSAPTAAPDANEDPRELAALSLGLLLGPVLAWIVAMGYLHAFTARYVLHSWIGIFLLVPLFAQRVFGRTPAFATALLIACSLPPLGFVARGGVGLVRPAPNQNDYAQVEAAILKQNTDVAVSNPFLFDELVNYSPALKAHCIFLADLEKEREYTGQDGLSRVFTAMGRMGAFRTDDWQSFAQSHPSFAVLAAPDGETDHGWLHPYLEEHGTYGPTLGKAGSLLIVSARPPVPR